jgi:membrane fusion protein (multidrug efflux system)
MKSKTKIWLVVIAALVVVVGAIVAVKAIQIGSMIKAGKAAVVPPEAVTSAAVEAAQWEQSREAIGSLVAVRGVTVGSELAGVIREIGFESGATVRRGAMLVRLDTATEQAQLAAARADAALAKATLARARQLRAGEANSPADLDAAVARAEQTSATVASLETTIAKKTIRAPFDGRVAIRQVELGQAVAAGAAIASLHSVTPMYAEFSLPQQALAELAIGQRARLRLDAFPGERWEGQVTTVNPEVDPATRNVRVRATFPNADGRLRPGMYVAVEVLSGERRPVLLVPATAVIFAPYGDSVFVLEKKRDEASGKTGLVARQVFVRLGERRGDFVVVTQGLSAGQRVASSGAFKLRNGAAVVVNESLAPAAELAPRPSEE